MLSDESVLACVIQDACLKGAKIYSWDFSCNGRIVIYDKRYLPQYFSNIAWAVDSLIHSYNLKKKYQYLYQKITMSSKNIHVQPVAPVDNSRIRRAIKACDSIILHDDSDFLISNQLKVYAAIQKAHHKKPFEYGEYILMQSAFLDHYTVLYENAQNKRQQEHFKRVIQFFHEMTFIDINEMM
jgi:hypothetical protein